MAGVEAHLADVEEGVEHGGVKVGQRDRVAGGGVVFAGGAADDLAFGQAAAAEGERGQAGIVIAAAAGVDCRRAAEIARDDE